MRKISILNKLSFSHFAGLFVITYGLYGWDVGQPVSYLSTIFFEVIGMSLMLFGRPASRQDYLNSELQKASQPSHNQVQQRLIRAYERRANIQSPE